MEIYDANGNFLARGANGYFYDPVYFNINEELGYTLTPGTTYKYKFFAVVNGQTYWSGEGSFTTQGKFYLISTKGWYLSQVLLEVGSLLHLRQC